jgi:hypothetical protein
MYALLEETHINACTTSEQHSCYVWHFTNSNMPMAAKDVQKRHEGLLATHARVYGLITWPYGTQISRCIPNSALCSV